MSASLPGMIVFRAFTQGSTFAPLAGGWLYAYAAGTTTPQAVYTDAAQTTPLANPFQLDSNGQATFFLAAGKSYKFHLQDVHLVDQAGWPVDGISAIQGLSAISTCTGTPNALVMAVPAASAYSSGLYAAFTPTSDNTAAVTLNAGAGVVPLVRNDGVALASGDLKAGATYTAIYNATTASFNLMASVSSQIQVTINAASVWSTVSTITAGTNPPSAAYSITPTPALTNYAGATYYVRFNANGVIGYNTLAVSGLSAIALKQYNSAGVLVPAAIVSGQVALVQYSSNDNAFIVLTRTPMPVPAGGRFKNLVVTYGQSSGTVAVTADEATVEDASGNWTTLKNINVSASLATAGAINGTDGSTLALNTGAVVTASCATNVLTISGVTSGTVRIGQVVTGSGYPAGTVITSFGTFNGTSGTVNLSVSPGTVTSGTVNLQHGNPYAVFISYNPATGVVGALISASATAQNQPATLVTDTTTGTTYSQNLLVSWNMLRQISPAYWLPGIQRDKDFQVTVGSYQTFLPHVANGALGTFHITTPTWAALTIRGQIAPNAANRVKFLASMPAGGYSFQIAPNSSYLGNQSPTCPGFGLSATTGTSVGAQPIELEMESDNVYAVSNGSPSTFNLFAYGWTLSL